jgi:RNA polymerase sigma factor (sigma-70 family)
MLELDDSALLEKCVEHGSDEAFATLVARHVNKVYSIALRHTRNPHHAEEITPAVFVILARKSRRLGKQVILTGWLCRTARLSAVTFVRSEMRRARREQDAHMQNSLNESEPEVWPQIAPLLDEAMAGLSEADHDAVAMRFFDGKSMKEIGAALGASEDACKMRVNRAVEKLRIFFTRRGIAFTAAALTTAISTNAVHAAPAVLAKTATAIAIADGATASISTLTLIKGALKVMAWSKAKSTVIVGVGILLLGGGFTTVVVQKAKARADSANDPVAYLFRDQSPVDANKMRQQLVGNWVLKTKRLGMDKDYTHYPDNNRQKMWTLTNWTIVFYDARSNIFCSASGPYELQGDLYTEAVQKGTGIMTNYIGTQMKFRLRVDGDTYYQTALGDKPGLQEIGHRLPQ